MEEKALDQSIKVVRNHIIYALNKETKTASIFGNQYANGDIFIPQSICHEAQEYIVTCILGSSFEKSSIKSVQFPINSKVETINGYAFLNSTIEKIIIPPSISQLKDGWSYGTPNLNIIDYSSNNPHFKYIDNKILLGKSDEKSDDFDVLIFVRRDIKEITIPSSVKQIAPYAFNQSKIESIYIPSQITHLFEGVFCECQKLKKVTFAPDSQLEVIDKDVFFSSSIESLLIPSKVSVLRYGWCAYTDKIKFVSLMPNNKNIINYEDKFIIGKTDPKSDVFDDLIFARRDLKRLTIPSFIRNIAPYSFNHCQIHNITIPRSVRRICDCAFSNCDDLLEVDFESDSELEIIEHDWLFDCPTLSVYIPPRVHTIKYEAFGFSVELLIIEIDEKSILNVPEFLKINLISTPIVMIPVNLRNY